LSISQLPAQRILTLFLDVQYNNATESGEHVLEIKLIDKDGKNVIKPFLKKEKAISCLFFPQLKPRFYNYGVHSVEVSIDGYHLTATLLNILSFDS